VRGTFSGTYAETLSGTTDSGGVATLTTTTSARGTLSFQFCVDSVTHATLAYQPVDNGETCDVF
jgi:hypothetical protein